MQKSAPKTCDLFNAAERLFNNHKTTLWSTFTERASGLFTGNKANNKSEAAAQ